MNIHLIRHGRTIANEKKLYYGRTDLPLSEYGTQELQHLKELGIYPKAADMYFTSGMLRTEQTLDIIYGSVERIRVPDLVEFDFGLLEMKHLDELTLRDDYQAWITDESDDAICPGGESKSSFNSRIIRGVDFIMHTSAQMGALSVVTVCHGGTIGCFMEQLVPGVRNYYEWQPRPGEGYTLTYDETQFCCYTEICAPKAMGT